MAKSVPNTTPEQLAIGKKLRQTLRGHIQTRRGGITFVGPKGVGKTRIMGLVHSKAPKGERTLNLFAACVATHAGGGDAASAGRTGVERRGGSRAGARGARGRGHDKGNAWLHRCMHLPNTHANTHAATTPPCTPSGAGRVVNSKDMPEALRSRAKELVGTWRGLA